MLNNAVDWVVRAPRPFTGDGPATLFAHLTRYLGDYSAAGAGQRSGGGETLALHLINYTGNMYENAAHRVEYVSRLRDLSVGVHVPAGRRVFAVEGIIAGGALPFAVEDSGAEGATAAIRIRDLGATETVLVRLASA